MDLNIDLTPTKNTVVKCNGGGGVLGHPVIYLNLGEEGKIVCPYCNKCFVKASSRKRRGKTAKKIYA